MLGKELPEHAEPAPRSVGIVPDRLPPSDLSLAALDVAAAVRDRALGLSDFAVTSHDKATSRRRLRFGTHREAELAFFGFRRAGEFQPALRHGQDQVAIETTMEPPYVPAMGLRALLCRIAKEDVAAA
jgi:hypothetical protein